MALLGACIISCGDLKLGGVFHLLFEPLEGTLCGSLEDHRVVVSINSGTDLEGDVGITRDSTLVKNDLDFALLDRVASGRASRILQCEEFLVPPHRVVHGFLQLVKRLLLVPLLAGDSLVRRC